MRRGRPSTRGRKLRGSITIALALLAWMAAPAAEAADFTVNPVQIFLSRQNPSAILTVQNTSTEPLRFQLNAFSWAQDQAGQMVLTPTSEVIFFPRLVSLVPGEQRIVRVGASVPPGPVERTYRIFVEELPPAVTQSAPAGQVRVLARMGIPIFIEPRAGRAELRLAPPTLVPGHVAFELRNTGTKHAIPQEIRVRGLGAAGEALWAREPDGWYILAGDRRLYEVPLSREDCARTKTIAIEVKAGEQVLAERLDVAAAACGP
ncbi:MAG TPA: fimbria/pilus periplasmic chaperone [Methylomirabilota bacterium]|nr:fimbria/pilus periplasmic chaperone [Methylomirabilota bacterium]